MNATDTPASLTSTCPSWCTQEHETEEHDGHCRATAGHPDTCIFPTAKYGQEEEPLIYVMLGDPKPGSFCQKFTPHEASDLLGILEDADSVAAVVGALRRVLREVA